MGRRKKLIAVVAVMVSLVVIAGLTLWIVLKNNVANTHSIEICVDYKGGSGDWPGECVKYRTAKIINGSENMKVVDHEADCSQYGGEPLFEYVGGIVNVEFRGCEIK